MFQIGKYEYLPTKSNFLGQGSFSSVYLGRYIGSTNKFIKKNTQVAIKIIDMSKLKDKSLSILQDEIKIMKIIKQHPHPNIVTCYDIIVSDSITYIILEYCNSGDMRNILINKPIKEIYVKYYFSQLSSGLHYLYSKNILHRDIKPRNILLTDNKKKLKIADFGFAKQTSNYDITNLYDTICGSPLYMAPEIMTKSYNNQTDLWSIGMILYEMLYGFHPLSHCTNLNDLESEMNKELHIPPLNNPNKNISPECLELLKKLLQKDINKRITWADFFNDPWINSIEINKSGTVIETSKSLNSLTDHYISNFINVRSLSTDNIKIINSFLDKIQSDDEDDIFRIEEV